MRSEEDRSTDEHICDHADAVVEEALRDIGEVEVPCAIGQNVRRLVVWEERVAHDWQGRWLFLVPCIEVAVLALLRVGPDLAADAAGSAAVWLRELLWLPIGGAFNAVIKSFLAACLLAAEPIAGTCGSAWMAGVAVAAAIAVAVLVSMERVDG